MHEIPLKRAVRVFQALADGSFVALRVERFWPRWPSSARILGTILITAFKFAHVRRGRAGLRHQR